jgi:hypothetical protein
MPERERELHRAFVGEGYKRDRSNTDLYRYTGFIQVASKNIEVAWLLPDAEFIKLPKLQILSRASDLVNVVAHLNDEEEYCYAQEGEVLLDRYNISGSIKACLNMARDALYEALSKKDLSPDIAVEFVPHWLPDKHIFADLR